jgi:hypothetical protein
MSGKVTIVRMRWWGNLALLFVLAVASALGMTVGREGVDVLDQTGGWWRGPILMAGSVCMLAVSLMLLNMLFTYRIEIDNMGVRLIGNFWTHDITWAEIVRTSKRSNLDGFGHHVLIEVDGTNLPCRHWTRFWAAGYQIPPMMEKGSGELASLLVHKKREHGRNSAA